jgi:hypothetical protein
MVQLLVAPAQAFHHPLSGDSSHFGDCLCNSSLQPINTLSVRKYLALQRN